MVTEGRRKLTIDNGILNVFREKRVGKLECLFARTVRDLEFKIGESDYLSHRENIKFQTFHFKMDQQNISNHLELLRDYNLKNADVGPFWKPHKLLKEYKHFIRTFKYLQNKFVNYSIITKI